MNERYKQLAERAGLKVESFMTNPPKPFQILGSTEQFEKFTELIVRDCMMICGAIQGAGEVRDMSDFASGAAQCRAIIKRDFGVQE